VSLALVFQRKEQVVTSPRRFIAILLVLLAAAAVIVTAQKGKPLPPPPPQTPLLLSDSLNIVTTELTPQLRAFQVGDTNIDQLWAQGQANLTYGLALADVDGDSDNELVGTGSCTDSAGVHYAYLTAHKQGQAGEVYSGRCDPLQRAPAELGTSPELVGYDEDADGRDEVIFRAKDSLILFDLDDYGKWSPTAVPFRDLALGIPAAYLGAVEGRSLAVGDADGDGLPEIVVAADYWESVGGYGRCRSYILVFTATEPPVLVAFKPLVDIALADFCVNYTKGLVLADTDGDGAKEIWVAGWTNNEGATLYDQRVFSFQVSSNGMWTNAVNWDFGWTNVFPRIAAGDLLGDARDEIVLKRAASTVEIYGPIDSTTATLLTTVASPYYVQAAHIVERRLILGGVMPGSKKVKKGLFLETREWDGSTFVPRAFYGVRDDTEMWTFTVGVGKKSPQ
jgi:hypothetical protein